MNNIFLKRLVLSDSLVNFFFLKCGAFVLNLYFQLRPVCHYSSRALTVHRSSKAECFIFRRPTFLITIIVFESEGRGASHIKRTGVLVRNFEKKPFLFCGRGLNFFSPLRGTDSKTKRYLLNIFFWLHTLRGTPTAPAEDLPRMNTIKRTKTAFFFLPRAPRHFYVGVPPPGLHACMRRS